jgi:hypothetical protein
MNNGLMVKEMIATVERERMVMIARNSRVDLIAQGGQKTSLMERTSKGVGALLQRMGRPLGRGSAPAGEGVRRLDNAHFDGARYSNQSMSIARF